MVKFLRLVCVLVAVVAGLLLRAEAWVVPALPATAAGQAAAASLAAFNSGHPAAFADFVRKTWPSDREPPDQAWFMRDQSGGFDLVEIEASTDTTLTGIVRGRLSDNYVRFVLQVDAAPPHLIRTLRLEQVPRPADVAPPPREGWDALRPLVEARIAATPDFSGVLLVAENGRPVLTETRGYADRTAMTPITPETAFRIASMAKMFTGVAIAQLVQAGALRFDAPIGDYLRDYPNASF